MFLVIRWGPNSDELFAKLAYNFSADLRLEVEYRHRRTGKNIVDAEGNVLRNVGSDPFIPWRAEIDDEQAIFLDGIRIDNDIIKADLRWEPIRDVTFDIIYYYDYQKNITLDQSNNQSYLELFMSFDI